MRYIIAAIILLVSGQAFGQANNYPTPSGAIVPGTVPLCISSAGKAVKCDSNSPLGVSIVSGGGSGGTASTFSAAFPSVGTAIGLYDGTNMVSWLTALALGDGVNGNNTGAVAPFLFNGTTWDRAPGTTKGAYGIVRDAAGNARGANVNASNQLAVEVNPPIRAARNFPGCNVTTAATQCLAANTAVSFLQVENTGTTNAIACSFSTATPTLNSATAFQLASGGAASWGAFTGGVPTGALFCIAATATTPLYVEWN